MPRPTTTKKTTSRKPAPRAAASLPASPNYGDSSAFKAAGFEEVTEDMEREVQQLDAEPGFETELLLRKNILPGAQRRTAELLDEVATLDERIARLESDLACLPGQDRIAAAQRRLGEKQTAHEAALARLEEVQERKKALRVRCERAVLQLDRVGSREVEARFSEDARQRMLKHSAKLRRTLGAFKTHAHRQSRQAA